MLKHATVVSLLLHQGRLSPSEKNELEYLVKRISEIKLNEILQKHLPYIDPSLFSACLKILISDSSVWDRTRLGQKLINRLESFARRPQIIDVILKLWRRVSWPLEK